MNIDRLTISSRLFLMIGAGAAFGLILRSTAIFSLNSFGNDIQQISHSVKQLPAEQWSGQRAIQHLTAA